ncbi:MAG TPA: SIMPL domain-containing protein [Phycisphaerae bacterium]|nr:SIMPL domain-containing protein [Phycisphaerae bacterium]
MRPMLSIAPLILLAVAAPLSAADEPPSISTAGDSTVYVTPDKVIVGFGVETQDANLDTAKAKNDSESKRLMQAILALNIDKSDVATDNLQVEIQYQPNTYYHAVAGYSVRRGYAVTLKDATLFEKLVDAGLKNGANELNGVSFETTELRKYRDQARDMAAKAAREKAEALAKDLDVSVGKPLHITEEGGGIYFGGYRFNNYSNVSQNSMQVVQGGADTSETLPLGKIAVRAAVSVTFELK